MDDADEEPPLDIRVQALERFVKALAQEIAPDLESRRDLTRRLRQKLLPAYETTPLDKAIEDLIAVIYWD